MKPAHGWVGNGRGRLARLIEALGSQTDCQTFMAKRDKGCEHMDLEKFGDSFLYSGF